MDERNDNELLREYAHRNSEPAFDVLVSRHINLVYSAALRHVGNPHQAEEITQAVFIILAKKSRSLGPKTVLSGWLYQTTRLTSANFRRSEYRRQRREQEAHMQSVLNETEIDAWSQIAPALDDAMAGLGEKDRNAVVLRFFENKNLRDVGAELGVSEEAAKMRVTRAVEKLRKFFVKRRIVLPAAALTAAISANAVQVAPAGLAVTISTAAALAGTSIAISATATATKAIVMTTLQKTIITATVVAAVGTGIYGARRASVLRMQVQELQQQQMEQVQQLQHERDEAMAKQAQLQEENARLLNNSDLLRLRGEVTRLRAEVANLNPGSKSKAATEDFGPSADEAVTNASPVITYSATVRADVPWNQVLVTGGWKMASGKRIMVFASPTRGDDTTQLKIATHLAELPEDLAQKLGLEQFYTDAKETKLTSVITAQQYEATLKTLRETAGVDILNAPSITTFSGGQASVEIVDEKETSTGEKYTLGPVVNVMPTISADGQSVDLGVVVNLNYPSQTAAQTPGTYTRRRSNSSR